MSPTKVFDVLVVYTDGIANSASSKNLSDKSPFPKVSKISDKNKAYSYFLEICTKNGLKAGFTTSKDLLENKTFSSYWTFENNKWKKNKGLCSAPLIFDKFSPTNLIQKNRRHALFDNSDVVPFNSPVLHALFFDKQKTYNLLEKFAIPTVTVNNKTNVSVRNSMNELQLVIDNHIHKDDFSRRIVIKDRFGAGGNNIYRTELKNRNKMIENVLIKSNKSSFVLQPFTMFKKGKAFEKQAGFLDIRIIYLGGKIIQTFVRTASIGDFRCNMSKGGNVEYIEDIKIPRKVKKMADEILEVLEYDKSLFTLDFIVSNRGNVYLMEGNCGPGLNWSESIPEDKKNTRKLIRDIVHEISARVLARPLIPNFFPRVPVLPVVARQKYPLV